jgi:hypothetical protein
MLKSWVACVALAIAAAGPALAQEAAPPAEQAAPPAEQATPSTATAPAEESLSQEQVTRAVVVLQAIVMAFESDDIQLEDKNAILLCIYENTLGAINDSVGTALALAEANAAAGVAGARKMDPSNHWDVISAVALVCEVPSVRPQP